MLMIKTSNDDKEKNSDDNEDMYNNDDEGERAYLTDGYGGYPNRPDLDSSTNPTWLTIFFPFLMALD